MVCDAHYFDRRASQRLIARKGSAIRSAIWSIGIAPRTRIASRIIRLTSGTIGSGKLQTHYPAVKITFPDKRIEGGAFGYAGIHRGGDQIIGNRKPAYRGSGQFVRRGFRLNLPSAGVRTCRTCLYRKFRIDLIAGNPAYGRSGKSYRLHCRQYSACGQSPKRKARPSAAGRSQSVGRRNIARLNAGAAAAVYFQNTIP